MAKLSSKRIQVTPYYSISEKLINDLDNEISQANNSNELRAVLSHYCEDTLAVLFKHTNFLFRNTNVDGRCAELLLFLPKERRGLVLQKLSEKQIERILGDATKAEQRECIIQALPQDRINALNEMRALSLGDSKLSSSQKSFQQVRQVLEAGPLNGAKKKVPV
ncbi:MAG: hypothetical protein ABIH99_04575 [Candidatus Micrarchaeota archaeon]